MSASGTLSIVILGIGIGVCVVAHMIKTLTSSNKMENGEQNNELTRYQNLKNKKRWGGKKLLPIEQAELDRLRVKYWWCP
jgi:hypothetical protein